MLSVVDVDGGLFTFSSFSSPTFFLSRSVRSTTTYNARFSRHFTLALALGKNGQHSKPETYDPNEAIKRTVKVSMKDGRAINLGKSTNFLWTSQ